jgi:DNA-binding response OmpR family regulator
MENVMDKIHVLLIEDEMLLGELVVENLSDLGFGVSWFPRAACIDGTVFLTDPDGKVSALDSHLYDVALVDGNLRGSPLNGWDLTPELVKIGLPVVAFSGQKANNLDMIAVGACAGIVKARLCGGRLDVGEPAPSDVLRGAARRVTA